MCYVGTEHGSWHFPEISDPSKGHWPPVGSKGPEEKAMSPRVLLLVDDPQKQDRKTRPMLKQVLMWNICQAGGSSVNPPRPHSTPTKDMGVVRS